MTKWHQIISDLGYKKEWFGPLARNVCFGSGPSQSIPRWVELLALQALLYENEVDCELCNTSSGYALLEPRS